MDTAFCSQSRTSRGTRRQASVDIKPDANMAPVMTDQVRVTISGTNDLTRPVSSVRSPDIIPLWYLLPR